MSETPQQFVDSLLCPVCFVMFEGRIVQCTEGHSLCQKCRAKILNSECPQCRSAFRGTRNYILEELIKHLNTLKMSVSGDDESTAGAQMAEGVAKLIASLPKPSMVEPSAEPPEAPPQPLEEQEDPLIQFLGGHIIDDPAPEPALAVALQSRGFFECRILGCREKTPVCRLLNHLRCFHADQLIEVTLPTGENEYVTHFDFPCDSFRKAIQISQLGNFFLIVNVQQLPNKTVVQAWVQCVSSNSHARKFSFNLQLRLANQIASFTDFTYGASSDASYIQEKKQCLTLERQQVSSRTDDISVDVKIDRTTRRMNVPRHQLTEIEVIAPEQPIQANRPVPARPRRRRGRQ